MPQVDSIYLAMLGDKMVAFTNNPTPQDVATGFGPNVDYQELVINTIPVINNDGCLNLVLS